MFFLDGIQNSINPLNKQLSPMCILNQPHKMSGIKRHFSDKVPQIVVVKSFADGKFHTHTRARERKETYLVIF